jgi:aminoglycoside phosphotransferase (APT) family kinase protein
VLRYEPQLPSHVRGVMRRVKQERAGDWALGDEPRPDGEDWAEHGGVFIWVAGFTEGGVPYGLGVDEFRLANERDARDAGWARAKSVLRDLLELSSDPLTRADVGFVRKIARGLSRDVFAAHVDLAPDPGRRSGSYVVLLPRSDADDWLAVRRRKELRLLGRLSQLTLPFRVPTVVGAFPDSGRMALVREFVRGIELELRTGRQPGIRPWEILGEIMAAIHGLDGARLEDVLPGSSTRREHAQAALRVFDGLDGIEFREARLWAEAHLPPAEPSVLVHGDLLGQNILIDPGGPPSVIDWEYAQRGDPAHDLAIVTRGVRRPFQVERGLEKLLEAYHLHAGTGVSIEQVRLHELCLVAGWYRDALVGGGPHAPDEELARLRSLLRRTLDSHRNDRLS